MKRLALALLAASALVAVSHPAEALTRVCRAPPSGAAGGPGQITTSTSPSSTYNIDNAGCVMAVYADVGWLQSQGFQIRGQVSIGPVTGTGASPTAVLPPRSLINKVVIENTGAGAPSAGVSVGTTQGGTQVVNAWIAAAGTVSDATIGLSRVFNGSQTLFMDTTGGWGTSNVTATVFFNTF